MMHQSQKAAWNIPWLTSNHLDLWRCKHLIRCTKVHDGGMIICLDATQLGGCLVAAAAASSAACGGWVLGFDISDLHGVASTLVPFLNAEQEEI